MRMLYLCSVKLKEKKLQPLRVTIASINGSKKTNKIAFFSYCPTLLAPR